MTFRKHLLLMCFFLHIHAPLSHARMELPPSTYVVENKAPDSGSTEGSDGEVKLAPSDVTPEEMTSSYESAFFKMIFTLLGLLLFVGLTVWMLRRIGKLKFKGTGGSRSIQIIEKRALSPKSVLYLIEIDQKRILVAESQLEVRCLATLDEPIEEK